MHKLSLVFTLLFAISAQALLAQTGSIRGFVYNKENDESVSFANIVIKGTTKGTVANADGFFILGNLKPGSYTVEVSFVGFKSYTEEVKVNANRIANIKAYLQPKSEVLEGVEITADRQERNTKVLTSVVTLDPKSIKRFSVGGDADILKAVQVLPGVITTGDQGGQLYIRGGAPIQNLILLDGMIVYNPFHSIGFFSVFDDDIIQSANVYTGGFNAEYGSRNSAVMDVRTRSGNRKRLAGKVNASTYLTKLLLEAPLGRRNERGQAYSSVLVSAKTSYLDQTSSIFYPYVETEFDGLPFSFRDLYAKFTSQSDNGSQINAFGFNFDDAVRFAGDNSIDWNSTGAGFNFTAIPPTSTVLLSGDVSYSAYSITALEGDLLQTSSVNGFNGGLDFTYFFRKADELKFGIEAITYETSLTIDPPVGVSVSNEENTTEFGTFLRYKYIANRLILEPGFRLHYYGSQAEASFEPRFGAKYNVNEWLRFKASGGWYSQNLIAGYSDRNVVNLFYGFLSAPNESTLQNNFRGQEVTSSLQRAQHLVVGAEFEVTKNLTLNLEGYIKDFSQLTNLNRNQLYDEDDPLAEGKPEVLSQEFILERGLARGIDLLAKYQAKDWYVWLAYSIGEITRDDEIMKYFPIFDRRHNLNLVSNYNFGKDNTWEASFRYNFGTGFPFTPNQLYFSQLPFTDENNQGTIDYDYTQENGELGVLLGEFNTRRLPNYHRLDVSLTKTFEFSKHSMLKASAGATNILNYQNIFYYDRIDNKRVDQLPIMPTVSVAYSF
jgi:hypothetical protein